MYQHTVDSSWLAPDRPAPRSPTGSAKRTLQVLLLEAGGETHPLSRVPIGFARFINRPGVNWLYASEPEAATGGRAIPGAARAHARRLQRHQRHGVGARPAQDYDHWAQLGNRGWSYQDVLPIFKSMESYARRRTTRSAAASGPLKVTDNAESGPLYDSIHRGRRDRRHQAQSRLQRRASRKASP